MKLYDNPENIGPDEILTKMKSLGIGLNRNNRFRILKDYSINLISKEDWIVKYCVKQKKNKK